jgi:protein TonB
MIKQAGAVERVQIVPIVFTPPVLPKKEEPVTIDKTSSQVVAPEPAVPVVAVADPAQVAFPVPVQSPIAIVSPRFAPPPQIETKPAAPAVTEFNPDSATHGYFPKPKYPAGELAARHQGHVMLSIVVGSDGKPQTVDVKASSGWPRLDNAAVEKAHKDWDFGPGPIRYFYVPVVFQIQ